MRAIQKVCELAAVCCHFGCGGEEKNSHTLLGIKP
jgi:hypothetical protein